MFFSPLLVHVCVCVLVGYYDGVFAADPTAVTHCVGLLSMFMCRVVNGVWGRTCVAQRAKKNVAVYENAFWSSCKV